VALTFRFADAGDVPAIVGLVESAYRGKARLAGWTKRPDLSSAVLAKTLADGKAGRG
jgi:hypothetical protein